MGGAMSVRRHATRLAMPAIRARGDIQGLRAIAVLLVVLAHAGVPGVGGGYIGVDVFFVVSGFLIMSILLHEATDRGAISLVGFYAKRARRILPAGRSWPRRPIPPWPTSPRRRAAGSSESAPSWRWRGDRFPASADGRGLFSPPLGWR